MKQCHIVAFLNEIHNGNVGHIICFTLFDFSFIFKISGQSRSKGVKVNALLLFLRGGVECKIPYVTKALQISRKIIIFWFFKKFILTDQMKKKMPGYNARHFLCFHK